MKKKKILFVSLGCPKNLVDSQILLGVATKQGWEITDDPSDSDVFVINTCGFIKEARKESLNYIKRYLKEKKLMAVKKGLSASSSKLPPVILGGCMTEINSPELNSILPFVNHIIKVGEVEKFGRVLSEISGSSGKLKRCFDRDLSKKVFFPEKEYPRLLIGEEVSAYLKISDGCSKKCSFCLIPLIRGKFKSRDPSSIINEARELAESGVRELVVVSQDTTSYGSDLKKKDASLCSLLEKLNEIEGIKWIRLMYLYPHKSLKKLFFVMSQLPKVVPYIDMPVQHASSKMLKLMRRGHDRELIEELIEEARKRVPQIIIRTTFIVGHPGETEEDFQELINFVMKHKFEMVGIMRYSDEEQTPSSKIYPKIPKQEIDFRFNRLIDIVSRLIDERNAKMKGKLFPVILEKNVGNRKWRGRLICQAPEVDGGILVHNVPEDEFTGNIVTSLITGYRGINFTGKYCGRDIQFKA